MDNQKQQNQSRFIIAAALSLAVLLGWQYFFAPKKPQGDNANTAQTAANTSVSPTPAPQAAQPPAQTAAAETPDNTPNKQITIKSPLYEVKLDSKGGLATSWILLKNVSQKDPDGSPLFADGSTKEVKTPLQLISPESLNRNPRELPFRLATGDANLDNLLNQRNYTVSQTEETVQLNGKDEKKIDFVLTDAANGVEITKSFVFRADSYLADLQVKLTKGGQPVPNTKLLIGASLGDQGIKKHNFYHIEPEGVAVTSNKIERHAGTSFTYTNNESNLPINGETDWAGVADTYFTMTAIPAQRASGLEYRASKYDVQTEPYYDGIIAWITRTQKTVETRHLITAYVPITTDGSTTKIYTGSKDFFTLRDYNEILTQSVGREIDIEDLINYGWFKFLTKPLSIPILYAINFLYKLTSNYGIAIIIFTFLFYSLLFPLRWSQSKSFKKASANAPKMKEIQDKIKELQKKGVPMDDPRMRDLQMQQLKMTKDALPIGGCLPMLLQFPLLIALYVAVTISLGFRQATFLWLPDLSAGDPFHFLEFIFAGSMILSMKFTPTAPTVTPEQQMQQKMMTYFMPVMMLWVMWGAPAGLLIYWLFGNIVSFAQQMLINRINKPTDPPNQEVVDSLPKNLKKVKSNPATS
ncbi:MAG TPA: membrane protein insertase YidC [Pyrinomonadaceae bacterium]|nr:membrane protein insertase YidC [Pyrinomonadaceae bacterium]